MRDELKTDSKKARGEKTHERSYRGQHSGHFGTTIGLGRNRWMDLVQQSLFKKKYLFIYLLWLHWVLVVAHRIFIAACGLLSFGMRTPSCGMWTS